MKGKTYLFSYLSALVIGILLLIFHDNEDLYQGVVIAMGILICIPSLIMLISAIFPAKREDGTPGTRSWYGIIAACAGLVFGIWMLCMPSFFIDASIYTLGIVLILAGIAGILFVIFAAKPASVQFAWLIVPLLVVTAGFIVVFLGPDKMAHAAGLVSGIALIVYAVNGFASVAREGKIAQATVLAEDKDEKEESEHNYIQ